MKTIAIVPAAGSGRRLGSRTKKPFVLLAGKPLVTYAIRALESSEEIDGIVIAAERSCLGRFKALVRRYDFKKIVDIVAGGRTRFGSVKNCLERIGPSFGIVLIHDGARPLVDRNIIRSSIMLAKKFGACVTAVPESDTVKMVDEGLFIKGTLDRRRIYRAQTPQAFRYELIKKAYSMPFPGEATDDASLVERMGAKVKILEGSYRNIKVTTKEDLKLAEVLL